MMVPRSVIRNLAFEIAKASLSGDTRRIHAVLTRVVSLRDAQWTRKLAGEAYPVMKPWEAAEWLEQDRVQRARHVAEAARPRGTPRHY